MNLFIKFVNLFPYPLRNVVSFTSSSSLFTADGGGSRTITKGAGGCLQNLFQNSKNHQITINLVYRKNSKNIKLWKALFIIYFFNS